jgi:beta-lactamase superfamily II metal-dependent hydrolase
MKIYLLDMGDQIYGDCIVCVGAGQTILIDGGHSGQIKQRGDTASIPDQLTSILGPQPFSPDLLIVTHCHADHIGCLPAMIAGGMLTPKAALVADPDLGFGGDRAAGSSDDVDAATDRLVAALRDEPHEDVPPQDLADFIQDAATLESRYRQMLDTLKGNGTHVVLYQKLDDGAEFERSLSRLGLRILGPTAQHLRICSDAIKAFVANAKARVRRARTSESDATEADLYRTLSADQDSQQDMAGKGAALNDQSIVVAVSEGGQSALLTGDMQFAMPEQPGLDNAMRALRSTAVDAGPYAMAKLAHHGSYNGTDETTLSDFGARVLTISGGRNDPGHPDPGVLKILAAHNDLTWARTDRNGLITCTLDANGAALAGSEGQFNDASPNELKARAPADALSIDGPSSSRTASVGGRVSLDLVEITARIPHVGTRVTITIDVAPATGPGPQPVPGSGATAAPIVAGGKPSSPAKPAQPRSTKPPSISDPAAYKMRATNKKLLFVTATKKLTENVGSAETRLALNAITQAGHRLIDLATPDNPYPEVARALASGTFDGVVILGGYDVAPSARMDVLDPALRQSMSNDDINNDADRFVVWSDQLYGDADHDQLAELPVSRIPDGHSASLLRGALRGIAIGQPDAFGLRNVHRPFAETVFMRVPGRKAGAICSEPQLATAFNPQRVTGFPSYIMLHGSNNDLSRFWGEDQFGNAIVAFSVDNVPDTAGGIVFAGCCWGALTVYTQAINYSPERAVQAVTPDQSIALTFLRSGANAFVGCTGSHYSPPGATPDSAGAPMHVAFWQQITAGLPAARALFEAKKQYASGIPHLDNSPSALAIEAKTLRQFTCLGLGW